MKQGSIILILLFIFTMLTAETMVIGTGTDGQNHPLAGNAGFIRSAALYQASELGTDNLEISEIAWYCGIAITAAVPTRIYLKSTPDNQLTQSTWAQLTDGATLVFNAVRTGTQAGIWNSFALSQSFRIDSGRSLLVLVERNYGGTGAGNAAGTSQGALVQYTWFGAGNIYYHQTWSQSYSPPSGLGTLSRARPNLMLTYTPFAGGGLPYPAMISYPNNQEQNVLPSSLLKWGSGGGNPTGYKLYLGTEPQAGTLNDLGNILQYTPDALSFDTIYYWQVVPYNALGDAENCPLWSFQVRPDSVITSFPYDQHFDNGWSGYPAAPWDWKVVDANGDNKTWRPGNTNISPTPSPPWAAYGTANTNDWLITPPISLVGVNIQVQWWERGSGLSTPHSYKVLLSTTDRELSSFTVELGDFTCTQTSWQMRNLSLFPYMGETVYLAFYQYQAQTLSDGFGIDDFRLERIHADDLAVTSLSGSPTPFAGFPAVFAAKVTNPGYQSQQAYTVQLYGAGDTLLASATGPSLEPGASVNVPLTWTPQSAGADSVYARVVLPGDTNPANDQSPWHHFQVAEQIPQQSTIGSGNVSSDIPIGFNYRNSVFQTIYSRAELGNWGQISELTLYYSFNSSILDKPIKIWLGMTDQSDLNAGWIPASELQLVFNGNLSFPSTSNSLSIPLTTPFKYCYGSLVLMLQRPHENLTYGTNKNLLCQTGSPAQSRYARSITSLSVENPVGHALSPLYPKLGITISPLSLVPELWSDPMQHGFGLLGLGSYSRRSFTVYNSGLGTITISGISHNGSSDLSFEDLTDYPLSLGIGQRVRFTLLYQPVNPGIHDCQILISVSSGGSDLQIPITASADGLLTLGSGTASTAHPLNLSYKNSLFETIHSAASLHYFSGPISSIRLYHDPAASSFTVPVKIWLGTTQLEVLSEVWVPATQLTQVFDGNVQYVAGSTELDFVFETPYLHPGGNLVVLINKPWEDFTYTNTPAFRSQNAATEISRGIFGSTEPFDPMNPTIYGTSMAGYPKISFGVASVQSAPVFRLLPLALSLSSIAGGRIEKTLFVQNIGGRELSLMGLELSGNPTLGIVDAPPLPLVLGCAGTASITISYAPVDTLSLPGAITATYTQDPNTNPVTQVFTADISCQAYNDTSIGNGYQFHTIPISFAYPSSLYEGLYYPEEMDYFQGQIHGLRIYNSFPSAVDAIPTQIWMGTTSLTDLSGGAIPADELSLVFAGLVDYPSGENTISIDFPEPFMYLGNQNLVVMFYRPWSTAITTGSYNFRCQFGDGARGRVIASNSEYPLPESPVVGLPTSVYPKLRLITEPRPIEPQLYISSQDGGFGDVPIGQTLSRTFTIRNGGYGSFSLASVSVSGNESFSVSSDQTLPIELGISDSFSFTVNYNPLQSGVHEALLTITDTLPGRVASDRRLLHTILLTGTGLQGIGVGTSPEISRMPVAMNYRNSLYETIYSASELIGVTGYITGLRWNYRFLEELLQKPVKIWLGSTTQDNLAAGWIPSSQLTLVYDGLLDFYPGIHDVQIMFDTPFVYQGGNLAMMVQRPMDTQYYSMHNQFFCSTVGSNRSRKIQHDTNSYNPASPPATGHILSGQFPNTIFLYSDSLFVSISGRVLAAYTLTPIPGASVSITGAENHELITAADGSFSLESLMPNSTYQYSINAVGFNPDSGSIEVGFNSYQMGDLLLQEILYPPSDAVAEMDPVSRVATITWSAAMPQRSSSNQIQARKAANARSIQSPGTRILTGYWVWRLASGAESYPAQWQLVNPVPVSGLSLVDSLWLEQPVFDYRWAVQAVYSGGNVSPAVFTNTLNPSSGDDIHIPALTTALGSCYPNPFRQQTNISFTIKDNSPVKMTVYDLKGRLVRVLCSAEFKSGLHNIRFDGCDARGKRLPAGVYYYRFEAGTFRKTSKMVLL